MYNTVGETAGVTQDVGSDPTVGDPDDLNCCTLCGMLLGEEGWEERIGRGGVNEEDKEKEKRMMAMALDLREMSRMVDEDEEMDGEPDTTGDEQEMNIRFEGEKRDVKERCGERS